jgi:hypothetical protein
VELKLPQYETNPIEVNPSIDNNMQSLEDIQNNSNNNMEPSDKDGKVSSSNSRTHTNLIQMKIYNKNIAGAKTKPIPSMS